MVGVGRLFVPAIPAQKRDRRGSGRGGDQPQAVQPKLATWPSASWLVWLSSIDKALVLAW